MSDIVERMEQYELAERTAAEITRLRAEVERLVKSRNRWGQKYNKLLSAVRTENAYGVYTEARDEYRRVITEQASEIEKLRNDVRLAVMSDSKECTAISEVNARLRAEVERWKEAATPSTETKAAYWGEFHISDEILDDEGNYITRKVAVPWTTVKEIMAAISARAALTPSQEPRT